MSAINVVSFSELDAYRQCPHKWDLGYRQRWRSDKVGPALQKGTLWHEVLEAHYRQLLSFQGKILPDEYKADQLRRATAPLLYNGRGEQDEIQALVEWMYVGYLNRWGMDPDWRIVAVEHAMEVWLPTRNGTRSRFKIKLKIDLVIRIRLQGKWRLWIVDHKSGKDLPSDKELDLDDQFGLYTWAMRQAGHEVFGTIYDAARTQRNKDDSEIGQPLDTRFKRVLMQRNDHELDLLAVEAWADAKAAYATPPGQAPRHVDTQKCRWRCDFTEACLAGRRGIDEIGFLRDTGFNQDFTRH